MQRDDSGNTIGMGTEMLWLPMATLSIGEQMFPTEGGEMTHSKYTLNTPMERRRSLTTASGRDVYSGTLRTACTMGREPQRENRKERTTERVLQRESLYN